MYFVIYEGKSCYSYAPIAMALPDDEKEQLRKKFDIAYFSSSIAVVVKILAFPAPLLTSISQWGQ